MLPNARHRRVESVFRGLLDAAGLDAPDRVEYMPESVGFYWDDPRVAVFVDFEGEALESGDGLADLLMRGLPSEDWPATG